jgi:hypothetical protein
MKMHLIACLLSVAFLPSVVHAQVVSPEAVTRKVFADRLPQKGEGLLLQLAVGNLKAGAELEVRVFLPHGDIARLVGSVAPFPAGDTKVVTYDIGFIKETELNLVEKSAMLLLAVKDRAGTIVQTADDSVVKEAQLLVVPVSQ